MTVLLFPAFFFFFLSGCQVVRSLVLYHRQRDPDDLLVFV